MNKKILALLLVVVMLVSMFAACSAKEAPATDAPAADAPAAETPADEPADEPAADAPAAFDGSFPLAETLSVSCFSFSNTGNEIGNCLVLQNREAATNLHLEVTHVTDAELEEKRNLSFNGGDYYDIYMRSGLSANEAFSYGSQGILIDLKPYIEQYMPNLKALLDERNLWPQITSADGGVYALPQVGAPGLAAPSLYINKLWLDNLGLEVPTTADEFLEVLRAFANDDPNGNGEKDEYGIYCPAYAMEYTFPVFGIAMDYATYCSYDGAEMTFVYTSEEYKEFLKFWANAYAEGLINQDCFSATWDQLNAIGAVEETIGAVPTWGMLQHVPADYSLNYVDVAPFEGKNTIPVGSNCQYGALAITDKCASPEIICAWADYFYGVEGSLDALYGEEGVTYAIDEAAGTWEFLFDSEWGADADTLRNNATFFGWYPGPYSYACNDVYEQANQEEDAKFLNGLRDHQLEYAAPYFPTLTWTAEETEERAMIVPTINTAIQEYMAQAITGQVDIDDSWDGYVESMNAMGVARLQEIDQAAYANWWALNGN